MTGVAVLWACRRCSAGWLGGMKLRRGRRAGLICAEHIPELVQAQWRIRFLADESEPPDIYCPHFKPHPVANRSAKVAS